MTKLPQNIQFIAVRSLLSIKVIKSLGTTAPHCMELNIRLKRQRAPFVLGLVLLFEQPLPLALWDVNWQTVVPINAAC